MNARLEPPPVQLPPDVEQRVRRDLLAKVAPGPAQRRRWAPALAAAAATAVLATGAAVVIDRATQPPVAGSEVLPIDAGPVSEAERDAAVAACMANRPTQDPAEVRFARRVNEYGTDPATQLVVVMLRGTDGTDLVCTPGASVGGPLRTPAPPPSAVTPLVPLAGGGLQLGIRSETVTATVAYLVDPSIHRLEARLTGADGRTGAWYRAALVDGVAYVAATAPHTNEKPEHRTLPKLELRAFDADGNPVPVPEVTPAR
jgi:hypothetical protein